MRLGGVHGQIRDCVIAGLTGLDTPGLIAGYSQRVTKLPKQSQK